MVDLLSDLLGNPSHMLLGSASIALWLEGCGRISHYHFWRSSVIKTRLLVCLFPQRFLSCNINYQIHSKQMRFSNRTTRTEHTGCYWAELSKELVWVQLSASPQNSGGLVFDALLGNPSHMLLGSASTALWFEVSGLDVVPTIISFGVPSSKTKPSSHSYKLSAFWSRCLLD